MSRINESEKKLQLCQQLNNGTITQAAQTEVTFLEGEREKIKTTFRDYLDLLKDSKAPSQGQH